MPEVDPVVLRLKAEVDQYTAQLRTATRTVDQQLGRQEARVRKLETEFRRSSGAIGSTIKGLAATLATAFTGRELVGLLDNFTRLQNQLRVAGLEGEKLEAVQTSLLELSQKYGVSINGLAELYGKATDAGRSFNANEEQILRLTEATSQALLITGRSATQAQGAILGLSQALASGTVRAEEYNQINEGGLRPLLQAAAASERFGGDVNKLRQAMLDGKVSSEEFFNSILSGADQLDERASKATITWSGAVEGLTSALTVYFGEAGAGSGATEALASAIQALADNIDTIIPILAALATLMGVRLVAGAIAAQGALAGTAAQMGVVGAASFAMQARLAGAATSMQALRFAGGGLAAAFGGPVGLAVTALAGGLIYLYTEARTAQIEADALRAEADAVAQSMGTMRESSDAAGKELDQLTAEEVAAKAKAVDLRVEVDRLADAHYRAAAAARAQQIELTKLALIDSGRAALRKAEELKRSTPGEGSVVFDGQVIGPSGSLRFNAESGQQFLDSEEYRTFLQDKATLDRLKNDPITPDVPVGPGSTPPGTSPRTATSPGRTTVTDPAEVLRRFYEDQRRADEEILQAKLALATSVEDRAGLEREILASQAQARREEINANTDLTQEQRRALLDQIDSLYGVEAQIDEQGNIIASGNRGLLGQAITFREQAEIEQRNRDLAEDRGRAQLDALRLQFDLADTEGERRDIAMRILQAEDDLLRARLSSLANSKTIDEADAKRAQIALDALNDTAQARRAQLDRQYASPLERYAQDAKDQDQRVEEAAVRRIERLNATIADAMTDALGIDDPFLKDLIGIFLDRNVFGPLAEGLSQQGGGGDIFGGIIAGIGSLFGRASGGSVTAGRAYRVNEGSSPGRVEAFVPNTGGDIIPLGRMNAMQAGGGQSGGIVRVMIEEAPGFAARVRTEAVGVAVEVQRQSAPGIIEAAANETFRRASRPGI